jgi:endonuclease/exonuclease/phosphatase family metal-dependent hydrolase
VQLRALTWNLYHGRDFPPDPALLTWRSRLLRISERNETHLQVNRDLYAEFAATLRSGGWDVALLQECPPRWSNRLAVDCGAEAHRARTSRNSLAPLRALASRINPDLIASNEGGSNLTLVRRRAGTIVERRTLELRPGLRPERRVLAFTRARLGRDREEVCIGNLHASAGRAYQPLAEEEVLLAAEHTVEWAAGAPVILGGDLNLRPTQSSVFDQLAERHALLGATAPDALDHLLARGLQQVDPPHAWPAEAREARSGALAIRLSDHAPVEGAFTALTDGAHGRRR